MKKHQHHDFEEILERIEEKIQRIEPDTTIRVSDITGKLAYKNDEVTDATIMLLEKYGIKYQE